MTVHMSARPQPAFATDPSPDRTARLGLAQALTAVAATSALVASGVGLLVDDAYGKPVSTGAMLRGYDLVNLAVAAALLTVLRPARRGSRPMVLTEVSLLAYLGYTYAYYVFGTGFNDLFLLHLVVLSTSVTALGVTLLHLDAHQFPGWLSGTRSRTAAALLGLLAVALGGMWVYVTLDNALTGAVPTGSRLVETTTVVHLGIALDLVVLVPWYATAAVALWRRRPGGYPAAVVALVAGLLHQVSYLVALPMQVIADVPGAHAVDPGEPVIVLLYATALALLVRVSRTHTTHGSQ